MVSDDDEGELLKQRDAVDRRAGDVLASACADALSSDPPEADLASGAARIRTAVAAGDARGRYLALACGWGDVPEDDEVLWLAAAMATFSASDDPGGDLAAQASVMALDHVDWLAIVLGLVRREVGGVLDAEHVAADAMSLPEIHSGGAVTTSDVYELPVEVLAPLWQLLGALDDHRRLTSLGWWGLPRALRSVWARGDA